MPDPDKPAAGPGVVAVTLIIMLVIIGAGSVAGVWIFGRNKLADKSREVENIRSEMTASLRQKDKSAKLWEENFKKVKLDYAEMKTFYKAQLRARGEIIESYKKYLEMKNQQVELLELAMQNIASDLEVALVHEATVKQDLVTVLNQHTKALMILSEKDNIIDALTKERQKLKDELDKLRAEKKEIVPKKDTKEPGEEKRRSNVDEQNAPSGLQLRGFTSYL
jgi:hypothetical protein